MRTKDDFIYFRDCLYCGDRFVSNRSNKTPQKLIRAGVIWARPDSVCCSRRCGCLMRKNGTPVQRSIRRATACMIQMSTLLNRRCCQCGTSIVKKLGGRCEDCQNRLSSGTLESIRQKVNEWLIRRAKKCKTCENTTEFQKHYCNECTRQKKRDTHDCNHRQRCRRYGTEYHTKVTLKAVIDRDGRKCHYCNAKTVRWNGKYDPLMTTLDHVIPISKGGGHTMQNAVIAYSKCNTHKSNKVTRIC